ncbi:hypothetical protein [Mesonia sp. K7]|uniref:hypothetical protein n=1 Tax=Mesonia sp. K7 TaxID=2218606 RepID=UPI000DA81056|nr:hypothetical protein [Mesonia sp. K7]PZD77316.1 hypothetical protein DNG35_09610 [Mesonia sp. K7]
MDIILLYISGILGGIIPYLLVHKKEMNVVVASALPSLTIALLWHLFPFHESELLQEVPLVFYGASFVGMVNQKIFPKRLQVVFASIVFTFVYLNSSKFFNGFGGGLGTAACISVIAIYGLMSLKKLIPNKNKDK